jgi:ubiquinol-cytochrome c reductase cytochrome b subunit
VTAVVERLPGRIGDVAGKTMRKVFPDHWSFLLGEIAMYSLVVLVVTGIPLAVLYDGSGERIVYQGDHAPLVGVEMSRAHASVLDISFGTPGGLLLRQTHHWAALVFVAAIVLHVLRTFLTGAYRRPRRATHLIGVALLMLSLATGFFGLSLPDDLLSGTGVRVAHAFALSIPWVGPGVADLLIGGEFPSEAMPGRFRLLHVFVIPPVILGLLAAHMALVVRRTHTQFPGDRRRAGTVVGDRLWPVYMLKTTALFCVVAGVLLALGGFVQISPIWLYGPFDAAAATVPAQPDWYLMFVEGALRILPAVDVQVLGREIPSPFLAGVVLPGSFFVVLALWPFVEERLTGDRDHHHLLERPRDRPLRTAVVAAAVSLLTVLTLAANHDYLAAQAGVGIGTMTNVFRVLAVIVPPVVGVVTWRIATDLRGEGS